MIPTPIRLAWLCVAVALCLSACNTTPDKRIFQYLNTDGFGNRYQGNAEEENWLALGDTLVMTDSYHEELNLGAAVDIDGTILLPELGAVLVAGLTRTEIEALLMEKYSPYYDLLDIRVKITTRGKRYFIFGEVAQQGAQDFSGDLTIFEAVTRAVPQKDSANLGRVRLIRADPRDPLIQTVDLGDIIERGDSTFNVLVRERDIIYVPPTMLAQLGYFLDAILFPVKQVVTGLASAFYLNDRAQGRNTFIGTGTGGIF
ncbi:MAG: polysaccharide biosynthesis/export family protein [Planctomycetes bacterium]|nr:polysaccharide biosynthesis/export family protein [Planctomycetota bacterium]